MDACNKFLNAEINATVSEIQRGYEFSIKGFPHWTVIGQFSKL